MPIKHAYQEITGSKYTSIQLELHAACTLNDINMFLCSQYCSSETKINNPHQAAYYAFLINSIKVGIQSIKNKKDTPIQLSYGVYQQVFMISVSFLTDNATIRLVGKMLAEKCFLKNLTPAYQMLSSVDKEFTKEHGKDDVVASMHTFQKNMNVVVMSKIPAKVFEGKSDSFGNKVIVNKMNEYQSKLDIPSQNPIPLKATTFSHDDYNVNKSDLSAMSDVLWALLQSSLNGQKIDYHVVSNKLYIRKKGMLTSTKEQCFKYMKDRLQFTNSTKRKQYKDVTPEMKKKTSLAQFEEKQKLQHQKKLLALVQVLLQSGAVSYEQLKNVQSSLKNYDLNKNMKYIEQVKELLADMMKSK